MIKKGGKVNNSIVKAAQGTYFTMPGQKPYVVNPMMPKHSYITPEDFMGQIASTRPTQPTQPAGLVAARAQNRIASQPQPNANGDLPSNFIGSQAHPKQLPEVTVTAREPKKNTVPTAHAQVTPSKTVATNRVGSTQAPIKPATKVTAPVKNAVIE
jgi:hypothetical protein